MNGSLSVRYSTDACLGDLGHTILQPIDADSSSVFKQGSTVPAKFSVCDAKGASVGTPGVVESFRLTEVLNGTTSMVVDEPVSSTNPDTMFRWSGSHWSFNLPTKPLAAGKTYVYRITLNDSSVIDFRFGLR